MLQVAIRNTVGENGLQRRRDWRFSEVVERQSEPDGAEHQQQEQQTAFTQTIVAAFVERLHGGARCGQLASAAAARGRRSAAPLQAPDAAAALHAAAGDAAATGGRQQHRLVQLVDERRRRFAFDRIVVHMEVYVTHIIQWAKLLVCGQWPLGL